MDKILNGSDISPDSDLSLYTQQESFVELLQHQFSREFFQGYILVNQLCLSLCLKVVAHYHVFSDSAVEETRESIARKIGLAQEADYLLTCLLRLLVEERYLVQENQGWRPVQPLNCPDMSALHQQARELYPEEPMYDFIACCEQGIFEVLEGKKEGREIIFPEGDSTLWLKLHNRSLFMSPYAHLAAFLVNASRRDAAAILEIGAGTGAGTALIVEAEGASAIRTYTYTDIGLVFLRQGKRRFQQSFMDFKLYNVDLPIEEQGFASQHFDIVFGVNVLHVAHHLPATLQHIYQLLRPGGYLIIGEGSPPCAKKMWRPDLLFGFLKGWWNVQVDPISRPQVGFLLPQMWQRLFVEAGFIDVSTWPGPGYFAGDCYGGAVIGRTKKRIQTLQT